MRHQNSVFHQIQKHIPWSVSDRLVDDHKADHRVRRLTTRSRFLALLFGQLSGAASPHEIEAGLSSQKARLYHPGGRCVARATLADANARRPWAVFADLFSHMANAASRRTRRHIRDALRLLDATRITLSPLSGGWADMVLGHHAVKLHVCYDPDAGLPLAMTPSGQKTSDIVPAKAMAIVPGMTYVFDPGYYDFGWWDTIDAAGARFVTRLKSNSRLEAVTQLPLTEGTAILSDGIGLLPERMARSRTNPFSDPLREIVVTIQSGKIIRLVTNDLDAPAQEIAALYKQRWQIELFFNWIKQNLKIRHFLGNSENAVPIQVFVALIAYLVLRAAQACQDTVGKALELARLVRLNLMQRRPIDALRTPKPPPPNDRRQMAFDFAPN